jgi:hypothetical protein
VPRFTTCLGPRTAWAGLVARIPPVTSQSKHMRKSAPSKGHGDSVNSVAFSPDGKRVLTGSDDSTARLWGAATDKEIRAFKGHGDSVYSVAFSRDGARVLTGSKDTTARLWDAATGKEIRAFNRSPHSIFARTGKRPRSRRLRLSGTGLWSAICGISLLWTRVSGACLCSAFSNFRFGGAEIGSTVTRDRFEERPSENRLPVDGVGGEFCLHGVEHVATTTNVRGTSLRYGVVHYGTGPDALGQTAKSPNRWNPALPAMIFRVQINHLQPGTTYYYRVQSVDALNRAKGSESLVRVNQFTTGQSP